MDEVHDGAVVSVENRSRAVIDAWMLTVQGIDMPAAYLIRLETMIQAAIRDALGYDRTLREANKSEFFRVMGGFNSGNGIDGRPAHDGVLGAVPVHVPT